MLHKEAPTISYKNNYQIFKIFKEILGIEGISHFSLNIARPDAEMVFFSSTPAHAYEICRRGFAPYDGIISPEYYRNFEFYWWKSACHRKFAQDITAIREGLLGFKHGFMLVRKWNNFHIMYSFATRTDTVDFQSSVVNQINEFLKMGDFAYNEMRTIYSEYCEPYNPPKIEKFFSFEGGTPISRYTQDFHQATTEEDNKIIVLDFQKHNRERDNI